MSFTCKIPLLLITCLLLSLNSGWALNLIINGGFEDTPAAIDPGCCVDPRGDQGPPVGWTISNSTQLSFVINDDFRRDGNYLWLNDGAGPSPTASQDLSILPGVSYRLTGDYRNRIVSDLARGPFAVRFTDANNGQILETLTFAITSVAQTPEAWKSFDITRSFTTDNLRVSFISQFQGDNDFAIDNIAFETLEGVVPEPGSWLLFATALLFSWRFFQHGEK